jgi:long-subunit acyl-CoA synthetase (AMP-forming)
MISHKNALAFVRSFQQHSALNDINCEDVYPSYLPLPHLMERLISIVMFFYGAAYMYLLVYVAVQVEIF